MSSHAFSYSSLANAQLMESIYEDYKKDPLSVDASWRHFFEGVEFGSFRKHEEVISEAASDLRVFKLIDAYRTFGHYKAEVNPIATEKPASVRELELSTLGFSEDELDKNFPTAGLLPSEEAPLRDIIAVLESIYCRSIGVQYMGYQSPELEEWLQKEIEPSRFDPKFSPEQKKRILDELNKSELFEIFLHTKYVGQKRFSLEGAETLIPIMAELIEEGADHGMDEFVIGMAHRGRLNVLTNILGKSYSMIFSEFEDFYEPDLMEGTGDVKYHKGFSADITTSRGHKIHLGLAANPSHLEAVAPVVVGKVRGKQVHRDDVSMSKVVPIIIHGDASIAGQGVVYETMQFYKLPGYATGGAIHIVINNQIGFTTLPKDSRSTFYCTDIARTFSAPIFHVNAEDPEGCVYATQLAVKLRQQFHCDVVIELNGYRKYGHNESDEPAFTQPLQYQLIRKKQSIREIYRDDLIGQGVVEKEIALSLEKEFRDALHEELEETRLKKERPPSQKFERVWEGYTGGGEEELFKVVKTGVDEKTLKEAAEAFCKVPGDFNIHSKVKRVVDERLKMARGEVPLDWAMGEHLAFASLLWEGSHVRLSGQDSRRGTFTQRHAMWVDQQTNARYFPLSHMKPDQGRFDVFNSSLSEYGAMGFDFGYSLAYPSALVLWEGQFGDFANGAQIIIDQFISCSEQKWGRYSGLTLLLPHGYEGQGPEHSSARIERFLQLSAEANMQIVYPTTPAQYFHLLRRQVLRTIRKPLVVFTPKGLLRHPECTSPLTALTKGSFQEILDDPDHKGATKRLILCSGKIYYDLVAARAEKKVKGMPIVRIEQLFPFNTQAFEKILAKHEGFKEVYWVQEEPNNMGAWNYIFPILHDHLPMDVDLSCVSRERRASPAEGRHSLHVAKQKALMERTFA